MRQRNFGTPQMTARLAHVQLVTELANCSDERLFRLTVLDLKARYKMTAREIECVLLAKQATRKRFLETGEIE